MKKFPFSLLIIKELYTFCKRVLAIVTVPPAENAYIQSLRNSILPAIAGLEKAMGRALTSEFTSILFEKDKIRDNVFTGLRDFVSSYVHSKNAIKAAAALRLWQIFENIGLNIHRRAYAIETADVNSLTSYLKEPEATDDLATLGDSEWLDELIAAQDDFEKTYKERASAEAAINLPLAIESERTITHYLDSLLNYIDCNSEYEPVTFGPIKAQIEEVITDVLAKARMRITLAAKNKEEENTKTIK